MTLGLFSLGFVIGLACAAVIGAIVWINVLDARYRAGMTPDERAANDEEIRRELQIW
jgi:hypothetical protein